MMARVSSGHRALEAFSPPAQSMHPALSAHPLTGSVRAPCSVHAPCSSQFLLPGETSDGLSQLSHATLQTVMVVPVSVLCKPQSSIHVPAIIMNLFFMTLLSKLLIQFKRGNVTDKEEVLGSMTKQL